VGNLVALVIPLIPHHSPCCIPLHAQLSIYVCVCVYTYVICIHTYIYVYMCVCVCVCVCTVGTPFLYHMQACCHYHTKKRTNSSLMYSNSSQHSYYTGSLRKFYGKLVQIRVQTHCIYLVMLLSLF
jgi:hypothetical protein